MNVLRFRSWWAKARGGSSPFARTTTHVATRSPCLLRVVVRFCRSRFPGTSGSPERVAYRLGIMPTRLGVFWGFSAVHTQQGEHRFKHTRQT
jgi:hypothetical protein